MPGSFKSTLASTALVVAAVALVNGPFLGELWRVATLPDIQHSTDSSTHFVRMIHARDLYLPSGHHWGWEPFWFQGYVPFLLYPHLTYTALAVASALPIEPHRLFNLYLIAIYLALPLAAGLIVSRTRGAAVGVLMAIWLASASSTYGVGLRGVFHLGLITQQAGLLVFLALTYELLLSRRIDRAAVWLGIAPLVHVHTAVLAGIAWLAEGVMRTLRRDPDEPLRPWLLGSLVAALIATPTTVGLIVGWDQIGDSTSFPHPERMLYRVLRGDLLAPWPMMAAVVLGAIATVPTSKGPARRRALAALVVGGLFVIVALLNVRFPGIVGRTMYYMLRLRSLPFALLWLAMLVAWGWPRLPRPVRTAIAVLTLASLPTTWSHMTANVDRIANTVPVNRPDEARLLETLEGALAWVGKDAGERTTTLVLNRPRILRRALALRRTLEITGQPMIGGHGIELTSVQNTRIVNRPERMGCPILRAKLDRYAIGYLIGADLYRRIVYEDCLARSPAFESGPWWVFKLDGDWDSFTPIVRSFHRDDTWTELYWRLHPQPHQTRLVLPMAATTRWEATIDGRPAQIRITDDNLIAFDVPPRSYLLHMRYVGPPGEWASVALSGAGLALGLTLILYTARRRPAGRA